MLTKIINFSIRNKLIIGLMTVVLIFYGIYEATQLPIDAVPDITNNQVQVITQAPSFGATDIERLVTFPIEQANSNINGLKEIRSFSRFGLSLVTIVFNDGIDIYWARQQVAERLIKVQTEIPAGIGTPELGPISTGLGEIYQYVIRPKKGYEHKYDALQLRTLQDWIVRRQLLGVKGVAEVSSFGGKLKQYHVAINTDKLNAFNLTVEDVFKALQANNQNTGGAYLERGATVLYIRSEGLLGSIEDIENIAVKQLEGGLPIRVRDVAVVKTGYATRYGAMCYNDEGEAAGAVVMMLKGANSSEVIKNVKERVEMIQKTLPEGVVIEPFLDRTKMVNNAISTVKTNLMEGALIVVFILVIFLGNLRAGLLVASVIPLAMLFAIIMMNLFGVSGNLMSLGALDFGLIVDGAVIIVEAVMHQLHSNTRHTKMNRLTQMDMDREVGNAASKMMNSAVFGQIIILIVYLPILSLEGIEGKMFKPMAQTVAFALLGAFLLSLTYIPMMSALFISKKVSHVPNLSDRLMAKVEAQHEGWLKKALQMPKRIVGATVVLFVLAIIVLSRMGGEFIPALEEGDFAVDTRVLTGSNLNTTIEYTQKAAHVLLRDYPEVLKVVTKIGSGEVPTDPMPMEASDMMVILKDKKEWTSAKTFPELAEKMGSSLQEVPGITAGFQYPVQMRFNELMTGARQDVVCKIFGENLDTLATYAHRLGKLVNTVEGSQNLYVEPVTGMPQIIIDYNRPAMVMYGLSVEEVNRVVNAAFAGAVAGQVFEDEKRFDLVLKLEAQSRQTIEDVRNLLVPLKSGLQIPLHQLAAVSIKDGPNQIQREDAKRRIVVGFNVRGRDVESLVNELKQKVEQQLKLPAGYYVTYGGSFENLKAAKERLAIAVPVSLLLIFLLLYFAFNSVKYGLLIYTAIPLSAIGGIFFLALRGMPFSISAGVGFIALFGVAVLNGIVMISEFNRIRQAGESNLKQVVLDGTRMRLRPILMTAFVASLGFLPMALSNGAGAEVQRPLATVVIGGLLIATFLTLFVLPCLYIMFENIKIKKPSKALPVALFIALLSSLCFNTAGQAQERITLTEAWLIAKENNLGLKNEKLRSAYAALLPGTAMELPKTGVAVEVGQFNSYYMDSKFTLSQGFSMPMVYAAHKKLYEEQAKLVALQADIKWQELKRAVAQSYFLLQNMHERERLLQQMDSLYSEFYKKAALRLEKGESNVLEKATADVQQQNIKQQLMGIARQKEWAQLQFQLLLNTEVVYTPKTVEQNDLMLPLEDLLAAHPYLQKVQQDRVVAQQQLKTERAKLLPDFFIGYNNLSIRGTGADNKVYNSAYRFHSVLAGIDIPVFAGAQRKRIKMAQQAVSIAEREWELQNQLWQTQRKQALSNYRSYVQQQQQYAQAATQNADLILKTAHRQFYNGEINYLEYILLLHQAFQIKLDYLNAQQQVQENLAELHYLNP